MISRVKTHEGDRTGYSGERTDWNPGKPLEWTQRGMEKWEEWAAKVENVCWRREKSWITSKARAFESQAVESGGGREL